MKLLENAHCVCDKTNFYLFIANQRSVGKINIIPQRMYKVKKNIWRGLNLIRHLNLWSNIFPRKWGKKNYCTLILDCKANIFSCTPNVANSLTWRSNYQFTHHKLHDCGYDQIIYFSVILRKKISQGEQSLEILQKIVLWLFTFNFLHYSVSKFILLLRTIPSVPPTCCLSTTSSLTHPH